jgi:outer membrane protein assembly factor BamA
LISRIGKPLLKENLDLEYSRLDLLDIFSKIIIDPKVEEDEVILTYNFVETFPFVPTVSVQITDENAISAGGGFKTPNLFGKDVLLWIRLLAGGATTVEFFLDNPWITGNHLGYRFEYFHHERDNLISDFSETANEFSLKIGSYIGEYGRVGGGLGFTNIRSDINGTTLSPENSDSITRIIFYIGYDSRDRFSDTRRGWWNELSIARELKIFKSSSNFYQVDLDIRRYQPLPFWDRHILALFSLLTLRTGEVGIDIAPWQQFGVGGTNTVRGWEYGFQKGKNQFVNTIEYRITLLRPRHPAVKDPFLGRTAVLFLRRFWYCMEREESVQSK